ncbi:hypothetical protein BDY19DRAFT_961855 [Irpex rosettiformis]|uniref:Uncharacterized protein n=1 Tax=Irpex rosettiformis TaxID=378272 RepID=A0ACB8TVV2_9APHY|nr:hypothetical protein BDY19DRAFT_961855 [Irpex rosettiformis]
MPLVLTPVSRFFKRFRRHGKNWLDFLSNDILVDAIFIYLDIKDILRLRRVSKLYYHLTHHTVVWKRLLRWSELPLPPLPPTSRHSLQNLTGLEAERLLTRAHSLDKIWCWRKPNLFDSWKFNAHHYVAHMVLLPGSQYLVATVSDFTRKDWSLVVYSLDSRWNVIPIARIPTTTKGYNLQAKYLTINGVHGITIAYVRRDWRRRRDGKRGINVSEYSGEHNIDAPYPLKHECIAYHVPLTALEDLCDARFVPGSRAFIEHARKLPPPFTRVARIRTSKPLGTLSLDDFVGQPHLTLIKYSNEIIFKPLNGGPTSVLNLIPYPDFTHDPHRIKAVRPLPQQQQILIVREITVPPGRNPFPITAIELQDIPVNKTDDDMVFERSTDDSVFLYDDQFTDIYISEHRTPNWVDESVNASLQPSSQAYRPLPVSVFCKTVLPSIGLLRITFYPQRWDSAYFTMPDPALQLPLTHQYRYTLMYCSPVRFVECHANCQYRILPGSQRTLLYTVPWDDITDTPPVLGFFRYHDKELFADQPEDLEEANLETDTMRRPIWKLPFNYEKTRFSCLAWDETVGRICFARPDSTELWVMDFSKRPKEDFLGRRMPVPVEQDHDVPMTLD